jgi:ABC-2 type transport system permease protein
MKIWHIFHKGMLEQIRDLASLSMVLVLCPFFVLLCWMMSSGGSTTYKIMVVGVLTVGSVIAFGIMAACFCKNATAVLTIGTLPFFLLMWFTGAAMPLPRATLFTLAGREVAFNDLLPPTHAVVAMNKIVSLGAPLSDVMPELVIMMTLTIIYFAIGVVLFKKTQLQHLI